MDDNQVVAPLQEPVVTSNPDVDIPATVDPEKIETVESVDEAAVSPVVADESAVAEVESIDSGTLDAVTELPEQVEAATDAPSTTLEEGQDDMPTASEDDIQSLSDRLNAVGLQYQAETDNRYTQSQSETLDVLAANAADQMTKLEYIASTLFTMHERVGELSNSVALLSHEIEKVSGETEKTVKWSESTTITSALSRWFLVSSIVVLITLTGGVIYLAISQYQLQQQQNAVSKLVASEVEIQAKRMAEFDKHFAEMVGGQIKDVRETISKESIMSKLNKLRNGAAEARILRKTTGDWLIPTGKTEELITDHDTIEALNQAFEKSGRSLIVPPSIPPHKVVCILKPDGKGGTAVVVTRETVS